MSDHDLDPWTPEVAALLDAEREAPGPPPGARERVWARVEASMAPAPPAGGGATLAAAKGAALLTVVAGVAWLAWPSPEPAPPPAPAAALSGLEQRLEVPSDGPAWASRGDDPAAAPAPAAIATPHPPKPPAPAGEEAGAALADAAPPEPARSPEPARDLDAERRLLDGARRALVGGRPAEALRVTRRHKARYPRGFLAEERDALAIRALARAGRPDAARARAERFLARHPRSIHRAAVEAALEP